MDVNNIFFTRFAPAKKMEIVNSLSETELLAINIETIKRMVIEVGTKNEYSKVWSKRLVVKNAGNDWNSDIIDVELTRSKVVIDFYVQFSNTDTNTCVECSEFLRRGEYRGSIKHSDRYGNPQTYYYIYSQSDKAKFVKALVVAYLTKKYADKL